MGCIQRRKSLLCEPSAHADAIKQIFGPVDPPAAPKKNPKTGNPKRQKKTKLMEHAKALVLTEKICYIAAINRIYENPPLATTTLDSRKNITISFPPSPLPSGLKLPPFTPPTSKLSASLSAAEKKLKLKKKERDDAAATLTKFGETVRRAEYKKIANHHRPKSSYFPSSVCTIILDKLLSFDSLESLTAVVQPWIFALNHTDSLYELVIDLQTSINSDRDEARLAKNAKQRATRKAKKAAVYEESSDEDEESEEESSSVMKLMTIRGLPRSHPLLNVLKRP
ncbi:hypothetical protein B0H13DRAFT_1911843 [Mycena leptocephala]|nr:hypothetical protein B0H13DRAFT_1911843 [Mycena leptocephala]